MDEDMVERAESYATKNDLRIIGRLGYGVHGIVYGVKRNTSPGVHALKIHKQEAPYERERDVYLRFREDGVYEVLGFAAPELIHFDDNLQGFEMTLVKPPFVLDYASAYLDSCPDFTEEVWEDWRIKNAEQFGDDWLVAQRILSELEEHGVYMLDPSPSNIRFR